jgi:hypothetical protein
MMFRVVRTSETSVDNYFTRQYIPEDNSEHQKYLSFQGLPVGQSHVVLFESGSLFTQCAFNLIK